MSRGYIHSFQSLGTVDGPGVRFVVFFQGCNLRCKCCHNPDTWKLGEGSVFEAEEIVSKVLRYKEYFKDNGGITLSGGEPLLQADFAADIFRLCKEHGINTCLDTSGSVLNESVMLLLGLTDRVLLDIKYTSDNDYKENVGCSYFKVLDFLSVLDSMMINTTLRQVIVPSVNDSDDNIIKLRDLAIKHKCVDKIELLPFRKICQTKYDEMGLVFPFSDKPTPTKESMERLRSKISDYI
ncbi:MAG: pyruvate formate lyase-activating protein [Ruminococcaceae bacterium]|nr:pyruvate formate lyase-activating protein [Oscillospiraceae bacterium]